MSEIAATYEQRSTEWFKARVGRVTGSRVGAILGINPYKTRADVLREMVREYYGAESEFTGNAATEHGVNNEETALKYYEFDTGNVVEAVGLIVHPEYDWLAVSPDGLVGTDGGVEVKCPFSGKLKSIEDQPYYHAQIMLCLAVTGLAWWDYYCWTQDEQLKETVHHDPEWLPSRLPALQSFHSEYVETVASKKLSQPHLDPKEIDLSGDGRYREAADAYAAAKDAYTMAEDELNAAKCVLVGIANDSGYGKVVGCGVQVIRAERKGNVDYAKIPELNGVDLGPFRKKSTTYWTVK